MGSASKVVFGQVFSDFRVFLWAKMPPKAAPKAAGPSKKTEAKKKEKIIEDKTFGLKNKKGAKNQKFIQQVQHQVKGQVAAKKDLDSKKEDKKKEQLELNQLFRPVTTQKVEKGADPKSVVCAFYKQGQCTKGDKCKFSHDVAMERKAEKRSVYVDMRDDELDGMENWDEEKLKEVVDKKHAEMDKKNPKTEIICKYFLEALEKSKYGWFWECPNGEKCFYRHALPPGFVLKKDKKKDDKVSEISIEELVEKERANLGVKQTKITLETFLAWKKKKITEKVATADKEAARKKAEFKAGRSVGISGREMFTFRPELAADDEMEEGEATFDTSKFSRDEEDEKTSTYMELTIESLAAQARECDGSGTIAPQQRVYENPVGNADVAGAESGGAIGGVENGIDGPSDLAPQDIPIDEALFLEDDDLEELERDLDEIAVDS